MKKKVVTTLLATMLSVSMAAAPVMAFDEDAAGFEVTADDFGSEVTEETDEADSDVEVVEDTDENADSDIDVVEEETDEVGTEESDFSSDETDFFSDDTQAGTVTLNGSVFEIGKTYIVPLTLKNAHNLEQDSAAVACPGKFGTLTFDEDGTPKLSTNLRSVIREQNLPEIR